MDGELLHELRQEVGRVLPEVTELRRRLHAEPELYPKELKTRAQLAAALAGTSLKIQDPLLGTDLIGELPGRSDRTIVLRADLDALPIMEESAKDYQSTAPGVMHACGHDGHAAMLAGAVKVLDRLRAYLPVTVRFVFQPGEEMGCGGERLVKLGACDGAAAAFALHGWPGLPVGTISARAGVMCAAADFYGLEFRGRGGHAALPGQTVNPIPAAARMAGEIQALHDELNAACGAVVTVSSFHAGTAANLIPDTALLEGTVRYLEEGFGDQVARRLAELVQQTINRTKVKAELSYQKRYWLPVLNSAKGAAHVRRLAATYLPEGKWVEAAEPAMVAEDFAFYLQDRDGAMFWLGLGEDWPKLHTPVFDFNEAALSTGILMFCLIALEY